MRKLLADNISYINWRISLAIPLVFAPVYMRFLYWGPGFTAWDVGVLPTNHPWGTLAQGRWLTGVWLRCKAAVDSSSLWHSLVPGLQVATILSTCPSGGLFCTICQEPDHSASECASSSVLFPCWVYGHEWLSAFRGTKDGVGVPSRTSAFIGMWAPCVKKTIGLSIAQMPQLDLVPKLPITSWS